MNIDNIKIIINLIVADILKLISDINPSINIKIKNINIK